MPTIDSETFDRAIKGLPCVIGMVLMFKFVFFPLLDRIMGKRKDKNDG